MEPFQFENFRFLVDRCVGGEPFKVQFRLRDARLRRVHNTETLHAIAYDGHCVRVVPRTKPTGL